MNKTFVPWGNLNDENTTTKPTGAEPLLPVPPSKGRHSKPNPLIRLWKKTGGLMYTRNAGFWLALASGDFRFFSCCCCCFAVVGGGGGSSRGFMSGGRRCALPHNTPPALRSLIWNSMILTFFGFVFVVVSCSLFHCSSFVFAGGLLLLAKLFAMLFVTMFVILFLMISFTILFSFATWSRAWCCV